MLFRSIKYFPATRLFSSHFVPVKELIFIVSTVSGISIVSKDVHSENASSPILVTEDGIVIFFNDVHPENAPYSISVTEDGIVIFFNDVQFANIFEYIWVIDEGSVTLTTFLGISQLISFTVAGMFRLVPALLISINIPLITTYGFAFCLSANHFVQIGRASCRERV